MDSSDEIKEKSTFLGSLSRQKIVSLGVIAVFLFVSVVSISVVVKSGRFKSLFSLQQEIKKERKIEEKKDEGKLVRTDFSSSTESILNELPKNIPIEKSITPAESYLLQQYSKRQYTLVFNSTSTVASNSLLFEKFLKDDGWRIVNSKKDKNLSYFYAEKYDYALKLIRMINITITTKTNNESGALVNISYLK